LKTIEGTFDRTTLMSNLNKMFTGFNTIVGGKTLIELDFHENQFREMGIKVAPTENLLTNKNHQKF